MILARPVFTAALLVVLYYSIFKKILHKPAYYLASSLRITKKFSLEQSKGAIGFILVVFSHIMFVIFSCAILKISILNLGIQVVNVKLIMIGILLGAGLAGTTAILSLFVIKLLARYFKASESKIFASLSSGWFKSYEYLKSVFPFWISYPLIVLQLSCEELVFRSIFINYFMIFGLSIAVIISSILFIVMQFFQMPNLRSAFFPVLGAVFMGPVHGYLYAMTGEIWPLIFSHTIFFIIFTM